MKFEKENMEKTGVFQRFTDSKVASLLFLCLSSVLIYNVIRSIIITSEKLEILNQAEGEVSELRLTNLELLTLSEYMSSDEYLETEARNRLNLSKEGETTFVISDEILAKGINDVDEILNKDDVIVKNDNLGNWYTFFLDGI